MKSMTVKKSGKIEHMDGAHDDQVFSYLMALYVWYDGKDLANNYHIEKSTIKTDQNIELDEDPFEDALEAKEHIEIDSYSYEESSESASALQWLEENKTIVDSNVLSAKEFDQLTQIRTTILSNNKSARESYAKKNNLEVSMFEPEIGTVTYVNLPNSIYTGYDDYEEDDEIDFFNSNNVYDRSKVLQGNLSDIYDKV